VANLFSLIFQGKKVGHKVLRLARLLVKDGGLVSLFFGLWLNQSRLAPLALFEGEAGAGDA
jgi:hypothetical protein